MTTVSNSIYEKKSSRTTAAAALTQGTGLTHIISLSPRQFVTIDQTTMKAINKIINSIICCIFASKMSSYIFILCIWQTLLSKATYIAVLQFLSVLAFPGNQTHDLGDASTNALLFDLDAGNS